MFWIADVLKGNKELLEQKEEEINCLKEQIDYLKDRRDYWRNMCNGLYERRNQLLSKNESYLTDLIKYEKEIKELNEKLENQKEVYSILKNSHSELENENKALKGKLEKGTTRLQSKVYSLEQDNKELLHGIQLRDNEIYNKKEEITILEREISLIRENSKKNRKKYIDLKKAHDNIDKAVIKDYLINKHTLLEDQNAPTPLRELIHNLIQEINS